MRRVLLFVLLTLVPACAAQARSPIVHEPLDVPPVPPRVIVPEIEEVPLPDADPAAPRPAPHRTDAAPKPADKPADPPKTQEPPRTEDVPRVRTPQMANNEQADRDVRAIMARAQGMLERVPYGPLSNPAKQQYDTARRFIAQADRALRIRNYVFARNLADKAETLARQLGK